METKNVVSVDGRPFVPVSSEDLDLIKINDQEYHFIYEGESIRIEVEEVDRNNKTLTLLLAGNRHVVKIGEPLDQLIKSLGFNDRKTEKEDAVYAPMPGLIKEVLVSENEEIKEGQALVVLEAMKMENILKAKHDGVITSIEIEEGQTVDKNDLLMKF